MQEDIDLSKRSKWSRDEFVQNECDLEKDESVALIIKARDSLIDLSLNYSTVNFLDHSSFVDLTGDRNYEIDDSSKDGRSLAFDSQAGANLIVTNDLNLKKRMQTEAH